MDRRDFALDGGGADIDHRLGLPNRRAAPRHRAPIQCLKVQRLKVLGIAGWSGSGKTTLITALIPCLRARGFTVSTIKHAHHLTTLDQPGKDSFRHAEAGAEEVILAGIAGFALFGRPAPLAVMLARLAPVDLVLAEGFRDEAIAKLEVHRPSLGRPPLWSGQKMLAVASDAALPDCPVPVLDLNAPAQIAHFLIAALKLDGRATKE